MFKKILAFVGTLALTAGIAVVAVTVPALATSSYPTGSDANHTENWQFVTGETCTKIEPVNTVPYVLPAPAEGRTYTRIVVKAGSDQSTSNPNAVFENPTAGQGYKHPEKDSISHIIWCTVPTPFNYDWQYAAPTCDALTVVYPANIPAGQANDANVKILYGSGFGTELTLNFHKDSGTWSGTKVFTFSTHPNWPSNIGPYKVVWTQVAGTNYHWTGEVSCGSLPADAVASVTIIPPTCSAAAQLVLNTPTYATWGPVTGAYSVTATATAGHTFADGNPTKTFTGVLAAQLSDTNPLCTKPPVCIPASSVSYTYVPATNSGVITVTDTPNSTGELCQGFWVTAASWKYTTNAVWPQVRDIVQKLPKITTPGEYPYEAAVSCGQGDIYASFTAQPDPTPTLIGPSNPFPETFLHGMGFTGPRPTWVQQAVNCTDAPVTVPTAAAIEECGTYGSVTVPADTEKIDYTLTGNGTTGTNVVTAVAFAPYVLKNYPAGGWTFELGEYRACVDPATPTFAHQQCEAGAPQGGSITVDLMDGVTYTITGPNGFEWISDAEPTASGLAPGNYVVRVETAAGYELVGGDSWPFLITINEPERCVLIPIPVIATSAIECDVDGSFTLPLIDGVTWFVDGAEMDADTYPVTSAKTIVLTAELDDTTYGWDGDLPDPWELVFEEPESCVTNDADAQLVVLPATCGAPGSVDDSKTSLTFASWSGPLPTEPGTHTVTALADAGHAFSNGLTTKSIEIEIEEAIPLDDPSCDLPTEGLATPSYTFTQMTCTASGSYSVGAEINGEFVQWRHQGSDELIPFDTTFVVGSARTITLIASSTDPLEHGLVDADSNPWVNPVVLKFAPASADCDLVTLALTGIGGGAGLTLAGGFLFLGFGGLLVFARQRKLIAS